MHYYAYDIWFFFLVYYEETSFLIIDFNNDNLKNVYNTLYDI